MCCVAHSRIIGSVSSNTWTGNACACSQSQEKKHTLRSFAAYADWAKSVHFSEPSPTGRGRHSRRPSKRPKALAEVGARSAPEPSIEDIEGEFWRIVEAPDDVIETLYGQVRPAGHGLLCFDGSRHVAEHLSGRALDVSSMISLIIHARRCEADVRPVTFSSYMMDRLTRFCQPPVRTWTLGTTGQASRCPPSASACWRRT